ncbi:carbohydrate ABC transporter permease [Paenibacillus agricola]|uniref:Carbohydrate ABC transporter permease n=1 Tax=Paenibacillus agricola TaxID=2716264 RepID=A0ABX0JCB2_9BACL|nr:carbohydrate ABC transporter permease [Paenibacillus agricola]NHN34147.1 carbohydrate ABC transporter permease [Paenibacillus agricola]
MKETAGEKCFYVFNYVVLSIAGLSCILPFMHVFALSFSDSAAITSGFVIFWPIDWTGAAYSTLIVGTNILKAFLNSVIITVIGVILSMTFTIMAAYPLSRPYFYYRRLFTLGIVFTMIFSGGLVPTFLVIKGLGLVNSYGAIWITGLVSAFNMLVMKSFFENIPVEMEEAARMDGCNEFKLLFKVMLPLSVPVLAALTLFYGVGYWNAFMSVLIYINDTLKFNLTVLVQQMVRSQSLMQEMNRLQPEDILTMTPDSIKAAAVLIMVAPMLLVYPFLQKYFIKGIMLGAIKG